MNEYLEIARGGAPHGIRGEVRCELYCDGFETVRAVRHIAVGGPQGPVYQVASLRMHGERLLIHLCGIDTPEQATLLRGKGLYAPREELQIPKDRVLNCDLLGLPVYEEKDGKHLGVLREVIEYPAGNVFRIETPHGDVLFPAVPAFLVRAVPVDGIYVRSIPGMFDDAAEDGNNHEI